MAKPKFDLTEVKTEKQFLSAFPLLMQLAGIEDDQVAGAMTAAKSWELYKKGMKEGYRLFKAENSIETLAIAGLRVLHDPFSRGKPYAIVNNLVVEESYRDIGIGSSVLEQLEKIAKQEGCEDVALYFTPENKKAKKYYVNAGYEHVFDMMIKQVKK